MKVLQFFSASNDTNPNNHDVFIWDSVNGVYRMSFMHFLKTIALQPHDTEIQYQKLWTDGITDGLTTDLAKADYEYLRTTVSSSDKHYTEPKVQMMFRALWFCATGEVMEIY